MLSYLALQQVGFSEKVNHLRAVAAFWIFVFHYYHFIAHPFFAPLNSFNPFELLAYHGYLFVYVFFILSGYLLAKAYSDKLDLKAFFLKRVARIFPAYYLCIVLYSLLFATSMPDLGLLLTIFSFDLGDYPGVIGHLWFINRLLECYLSFPLLWWVAKKSGGAGLASIYLLCLLGGGYWVIELHATLPDYYFSFVLCLSFFIVGILSGHQTLKAPNKRYLTILVIIFFIALLEWFHQSTWQNPLTYSWVSFIWLNYIAVLFFILIRAYLFLPITLPFFISGLMQKMGDISYNFYLYHFLVIHFFIQHKEYLTAYSSFNFIGLFLLSVISAVIFQHLLSLISYGGHYIKHYLGERQIES